MRRVHLSVAVLLFLTIGVGSCSDRTQPGAASPHAGDTASAAPTNRVDIGSVVRRNLGMTFARAEERHVARTLRVPARVELPPSATREERAPAPGIVEVMVRDFDPVVAGQPLYQLDSPRWREVQQQITDAEAAIRLADAEVVSIGPLIAAHERHHQELERLVEIWLEREAQLNRLLDAGGARGEELTSARASMVQARSDLAETLEKEAELVARRSESEARRDAARIRMSLLLEVAASLTGESVAALEARVDGRPGWQHLQRIERRAASAGVVAKVHAHSGAFVDATASILDVVDPTQVRVRGAVMQGDLTRLSTSSPALAVPPTMSQTASADGASSDANDTSAGNALAGALTISPVADADRRTIDVVLTPAPGTALPSWARPGVSAFLELTLEGSREPALAVPRAAVVRDGARALLFRRDPQNPDLAIRLDADLGTDDGRWVVVRSGLREGDEVIVNGAYQLMSASGGSMPKGGHFHADGSFHEGPDEK